MRAGRLIEGPAPPPRAVAAARPHILLCAMPSTLRRLRPRRALEASEHDADEAAAKATQQPRARWCPEENAGFLSRLLFVFVGGLIKLGYRWVRGGRMQVTCTAAA